jgi:SAM-dependent methyltransferase
MDNVPKGGRLLEMACGLGATTSCISAQGYQVEAFDISVKAIERAKHLAESVGQPPEMFRLADQECLSEYPDDSFDGILAMGLFRYLTRSQQEEAYRQIYRILKPGGKLVISHENILFNIFALNDDSIGFWADVVESHSSGHKLLGGKSIYDALNESVTLPKRVYNPLSISRRMEVQADNPLTYGQLIADYGFRLEKILYPYSNIFPPALESGVDRNALNALKKEISLDRADDWRSMFMTPQFSAFAQKE